jgi:hypothetical protein
LFFRQSSVALVDLILGKQKQTKMGRGGVKPLLQTFTLPAESPTDYCVREESAGIRLLCRNRFM